MSAARADEIAAVALGGVVGALARAGISTAVPHADRADWPWATFLANLLGCLVLGIVLDWVDNRHDGWKTIHPRRARLARPLLASGLLGGFTTFSTFSVETYGLLASGEPAAALLYALASALLGVVLVLAGRALGAVAFGPSALDLREDEEL